MSLHFTPECELLFEGGKGSQALEQACTKNPGHAEFISVKDFTMAHIPSPQNRTPRTMKFIRDLCDKTVKITVNYTSPHRPNTYAQTDAPYPYAQIIRGSKRSRRCGTGYMDRDPLKVQDELCPCPPCKSSDQARKGFWILYIVTAAHVVFDQFEAENSVCELFYDSEERDEVVVVYGIDKLKTDQDPTSTDRSLVLCVCHDLTEKCVERLTSKSWIMPMLWGSPDNIIASHPHGRSKKITVGKVLYYSVPNNLKKIIRGKFESATMYSVGSAIADSVSGLYLLPGKKYRLPGVTYYEIPEDADYIYRFSDQPRRRIFPPGTKFTSEKGDMLPFSPEKTVFFNDYDFKFKRLGRADELENFYWWSISVYDTPTCPGSSGAWVRPVHCRDVAFILSGTHAGSNNDNGTNQSSCVFSDETCIKNSSLAAGIPAEMGNTLTSAIDEGHRSKLSNMSHRLYSSISSSCLLGVNLV